jgi:hypothetical protein
MVQGSWFMVQGLVVGVEGSGFRVQGQVQGFRGNCEGLGFGVWGADRVNGEGGHSQRAIDPTLRLAWRPKALRPKPPHHARPVRASTHEASSLRTHRQRVGRGCVPHQAPNLLEGFGFRDCCLGVGVWSLEFGVWCLGFRVSGLWFMVSSFGGGGSGLGMDHVPVRHVPYLDEVAPGAPSHDLLAGGREEEPS